MSPYDKTYFSTLVTEKFGNILIPTSIIILQGSKLSSTFFSLNLKRLKNIQNCELKPNMEKVNYFSELNKIVDSGGINKTFNYILELQYHYE